MMWIKLLICELLFFLILISTFGSGEIQPRFLTNGGSHEVLEGESIRLDCVVEHMDAKSDYAVMWLGTGGQLIYAEEELMSGSHRFSLAHPKENVWNMTITNVEKMDSGTYTCEITTDPPVSQQHVVSVLVPPSINMVPDATPLVVEPGDDVSLSCHAAGNPRPKVTWRKKGGSLPSGSASLENKRLYIEEIKVDDGGDYVCTADNGVGDIATATKFILVQSMRNQTIPPWVEAVRDFVAAKIGETVNITCKYEAQPAPTMVWIMDGHVISFDVGEHKDRRRRYFSRKSQHTEATLVIKDITMQDFGDYECRVTNNMGTEQAKIFLSDRPAPAKVWSESEQEQGVNINLKWSIEFSAEPVIEYKIRYKSVQDNSWDEKLIPADSGDNGGDAWNSDYMLEGLNPSTEYEVQVQGRSSRGWGDLPRYENFHFRTGLSASPATTLSTSEGEPSKEKGKGVSIDSGPTKSAQELSPSVFSFLGAIVFRLAVCLLQRR